MYFGRCLILAVSMQEETARPLSLYMTSRTCDTLFTGSARSFAQEAYLPSFSL